MIKKKVIFNTIILLILLIIGLSVQAHTETRIYSFGEAEKISYNNTTKTLHSYDGFDFVFQENGIIKIYKNGEWQSDLSFLTKIDIYNITASTLKWVVSPVINNSNEIDLIYEPFDYTNFPSELKDLTFSAEFKVSKFSPLKITHTIQNGKNKKFSGFEFVYVFKTARGIIEYGTDSKVATTTNTIQTIDASNIKDSFKILGFRFDTKDLKDSKILKKSLKTGLDALASTGLSGSDAFSLSVSNDTFSIEKDMKVILDPTIESSNEDGFVEYSSTFDDSAYYIDDGHTSPTYYSNLIVGERGTVGTVGSTKTSFDCTSTATQSLTAKGMIQACVQYKSGGGAVSTGIGYRGVSCSINTSSTSYSEKCCKIYVDSMPFYFDGTSGSAFGNGGGGYFGTSNIGCSSMDGFKLNEFASKARAFELFDISSLSGISLTSAHLHNYLESKVLDSGTAEGDVNLTQIADYVSLSSNPFSFPTLTDLNSAYITNSTPTSNWVITNIQTALQDWIDDSRDTFAVALKNTIEDEDSDSQFYSITSSDSASNKPYISYTTNADPVVSNVSPKFDSNNFYLRSVQNYVLDFNLYDSDDNAFDETITIHQVFSSTAQVGKVILNAGSVASTTNLWCDTNDITTVDGGNTCHYLFSLDSVDANVWFVVWVNDGITNSDKNVSQRSLFVDKTAPINVISYTQSNTWLSVASKSVSYSCTDVNSNCKYLKYSFRIGNGGTSIGYLNYFNPLVAYCSVNDSNRVEYDFNGSDFSGRVDIDLNAPVFLLDRNAPMTDDNHEEGTVNHNVRINLTCVDMNSHCNNTFYNLNNTGWVLFSNYFDLTDGNTKVDYYSTDNATNIGTTRTFWQSVDSAIPSTTSNISASWQKTNQNITLTCVGSCKATYFWRDILGSSSVVFGDVNSYSSSLSFTKDGNWALQYHSMSLGDLNESDKNQYVLLDKTAPLSISDEIADWNTTGDSNVHLTAIEPTSGVRGFFYRKDTNPLSGVSWGSWTKFSNNDTNQWLIFHDGNFAFQWAIRDNALNDYNSTTHYSLTDYNSPDTGDSFRGSWKTSNQSVSLSCVDTGSGCLRTKYRLNGGSWVTYSSAISFTSDGNFALDYNSMDLAGNIESDHNTYVLIDKTKPKFYTDDNSGWQQDDRKVMISCNDATSDMNSMRYRINNFDWNSITQTGDTNVWLNFTTDYNWGVTILCTDVAGNIFTSTISVEVDKNSPDTDSNINANWVRYNHSVVLTCVDTVSGCAITKYRQDTNNGKYVNGETMGSWQTYSGALTYSTDGNWAIDYNSVDVAGNNESVIREYVLVDKTVPVVSSDENVGWQLGDANVHLTVTDLWSGVKDVNYRVDLNSERGILWGSWKMFPHNVLPADYNLFFGEDGNWGFQWRSKDNANNEVTSITHFVTKNNATPSTPTFLIPTVDNYLQRITIACGGSATSVPVDINYVIDYNSNTIDWIQLKNDTNLSFVLDISGITANTKLWFRCKAVIPDFNSTYLTNTTYVTVNPTTGFDAIANVTPNRFTVASSGTLTFGVDCSDSDGVKLATFKLWNEVNDTPMSLGTYFDKIADGNHYSYTYLGSVTGDFIFATIHCTDNSDNNSSKWDSEHYYVIIPQVIVVDGSGGGGTTTIIKDQNIITSGLIEFTPSSYVVSLYQQFAVPFSITIKSLASKEMPISIEFGEQTMKYLTPIKEYSVIQPDETLVWRYSFQNPTSETFDAFTETVTINLNNGQDADTLELSVQPSNSIFDFLLFATFFGLPLLVWLIIIIIFGFLLVVFSNKKGRKTLNE